jgi:hypothetical protein
MLPRDAQSMARLGINSIEELPEEDNTNDSVLQDLFQYKHTETQRRTGTFL